MDNSALSYQLVLQGPGKSIPTSSSANATATTTTVSAAGNVGTGLGMGIAGKQSGDVSLNFSFHIDITRRHNILIFFIALSISSLSWIFLLIPSFCFSFILSFKLIFILFYLFLLYTYIFFNLFLFFSIFSYPLLSIILS